MARKPRDLPEEDWEGDPPDEEEQKLVESVLRHHPHMSRKEALRQIRLH